MSLLRSRELSDAFDRAAPAYDRLVGANPGYHRHLRLAAGRLGLPDGGRGLEVLDLGCGTGASTAALLRAAPHARITAADASEGMLRQARAKHWPEQVRFVHSPAERLAEAGVTGPFDAVFAAYLVRNTADPDAVLGSVRGLLRPGGRLVVHEYTLTGSPLHRAVWHGVCWSVVMPLGALGPGGAGLYRHLWRSVLDFDTAADFHARVGRAGFTGVRALPVGGWQQGIVHTFTARRPAEGPDPAEGAS
ncbi:class I SAM-dependent methyltransferase [Streptomyces sp. NPDC001380]|uniref:class I SAM-dependent methyltransferase n=1 Tax=Streptomyces sp. NPDC001380 TaxID=3364566 RepID=UPI003683D246